MQELNQRPKFVNKPRYSKINRQQIQKQTFESKYGLDAFNDLKQYQNFYDSGSNEQIEK